MTTQYEREEGQLERDLQEGRISQVEFNKELEEMQRSYRAELHEEAEDAYDNIMNEGW
jgi:hypothetical protein